MPICTSFLLNIGITSQILKDKCEGLENNQKVHIIGYRKLKDRYMPGLYDLAVSGLWPTLCGRTLPRNKYFCFPWLRENGYNICKTCLKIDKKRSGRYM